MKIFIQILFSTQDIRVVVDRSIRCHEKGRLGVPVLIQQQHLGTLHRNFISTEPFYDIQVKIQVGERGARTHNGSFIHDNVVEPEVNIRVAAGKLQRGRGVGGAGFSIQKTGLGDKKNCRCRPKPGVLPPYGRSVTRR